jgi:hypothetical protein
MFIFLCAIVLHVAPNRKWRCNEPLYELWPSKEILLQFLYNIFTELFISLRRFGPVEMLLTQAVGITVVCTVQFLDKQHDESLQAFRFSRLLYFTLRSSVLDTGQCLFSTDVSEEIVVP